MQPHLVRNLALRYHFEDCVLDTVVLNDRTAARAFVRRPALLRTVLKPVYAEPLACDNACVRN